MALRSVLRAQGAYYLATGLLPFVSRRVFEGITGRKRDWWLVQTVGAVVGPVGAVLLSVVASRRETPEVVGLAASCAAGLGAIDVYHAARGRISPVYFADAALQVVFLAGIARHLTRVRTGRHGESPS